jgi:hypothetical protein
LIRRYFGAVWGSSASNVYAIGSSGIYRYDGAIWKLHDPAHGIGLTAIAGSGASDIVIVGIAGRILMLK